MGKLPDQNVAESLQRIAGVTIERNRGEGRFVTVRGFGPKFNAVTVNGRTLATDNNGREFSFDVLPSEEIGRAHVRTPVTNAHLVCRLLLEKKKHNSHTLLDKPPHNL